MGMASPLFLSFLLFLTVSAAPRESKLLRNSDSLSFPLTLTPVARRSNLSSLRASLAAAKTEQPPAAAGKSIQKSPFKYSMALTVSLPVGTPPQTQEMVIDTGSQLSWIQCHRKTPPPTTSFDPSLSSSYSAVPCNHPVCKPRIPDYTLPTSCDQNRLCHYSYFYADGTLAEGDLIREKLTFANSQTTPPLILGCATSSSDNRGILGMNLGRLSFPSQAKLSKFSYCVPARTVAGSGSGPFPTGSFVIGDNPNSSGFQYLSLITFLHSQTMPNLDPLAYTVLMQGIRVGAKRLDIPASVFRPDAGGSGQTMVDSGSEFTYLVDEAYRKVKEEIVRLVSPNKMKKGYVYGNGVADMCFDPSVAGSVGPLIGGMAFEFGNGVEIAVPSDRVLAEVEGGVRCVAIGMSNMLGAASNIIGNFHQQNLWVEFDLANRRVGFGKADCTRS